MHVSWYIIYNISYDIFRIMIEQQTERRNSIRFKKSETGLAGLEPAHLVQPIPTSTGPN